MAEKAVVNLAPRPYYDARPGLRIRRLRVRIAPGAPISAVPSSADVSLKTSPGRARAPSRRCLARLRFRARPFRPGKSRSGGIILVLLRLHGETAQRQRHTSLCRRRLLAVGLLTRRANPTYALAPIPKIFFGPDPSGGAPGAVRASKTPERPCSGK